MWPQDEYEMETGEFEEEFQETGYDAPGEFEAEEEMPINESMEMELAAELLDVSNEEELEQFLGSLIKKAGRAVGSFVRSPVGKALGGILKAAAKKALPVAGGALGAYLGGPAGARIGSQLASKAGRVFGLELEGLSPEDQEFEVARKFVRMASSAARMAAKAPATVSPQTAAKKAFAVAARRHAPGLLRISTPYSMQTAGYGYGRSGRWIRRRNKIILLGV
jgi:hypothetical protein